MYDSERGQRLTRRYAICAIYLQNSVCKKLNEDVHALPDQRRVLIQSIPNHLAWDAELPHAFDLGIAQAYQGLVEHWRSELEKRYVSVVERRIFQVERERLETLARDARAAAELSGRIVTWASNTEKALPWVPLPRELEKCTKRAWDAEIMKGYKLGQATAVDEIAAHWESVQEDTRVDSSHRAIYRREAQRARNLHEVLQDEVAKAEEALHEAHQKEQEAHQSTEYN
ncbi:hypothetical protein GQ53DRAFT_770012 [Thozetella sp. PMI_491]|nr:hypothetical protein GQ53DRAFT_770012 [Thozetella sp. PMI_491]